MKPRPAPVRALLRPLLPVAMLGLVTLAACGGDAGGEGDVAFRVSGEEAAKRGYPSTRAGATIAFADGWTLRFEKVIVSLGRFGLADATGQAGLDDPATFVVDLAQGDPVVAEFRGLEAKRWPGLAFSFAPPKDGDRRIGDVSEEDFVALRDRGLTHLVRGVAEKGGLQVRIALDLAAPTRSTGCTNGVDGTEGVVVRTGATTTAEVTVHLEHLFWDSLGTEGASLRFDPWAAAAGADGVVTLDELAGQNLTNLRGLDGQRLVDATGAPVLYNPGSFPLRAPTLAEMVRVAASTMAHFNGTGLCVPVIE